MRQSAAVLCEDHKSLPTVEACLEELGIEIVRCPSWQKALEAVVSGRCSTLIVDFDRPGAEDVVRMSALLPPSQRPTLLAVASQAWPGTGQAFHSGANRILYRPLEPEVITAALRSEKKNGKSNRRKSARYETKTLVYLQLEGENRTAISIDIGEHGLALQASEPVPMYSNVAFRCLLPGTATTLHGHGEVIWASDKGRAGLFFTKLSPAARKDLNRWLAKRSKHGGENSMRDLLPPSDAHVSFAAFENELVAGARE
jgi:FixJ family two-component response regulator